MKTHPPVWTGAMVAFFILLVVDISVGIGPPSYSSSFQEWGNIGIIPFLIAFLVFVVLQHSESPQDLDCMATNASPSKSLDDVSDASFKAWLKSEKPSTDDFFGNSHIAYRMHNLLTTGIHSIGLVGKFGGGKTTLIKQLRNICSDSKDSLIFCEHSCWGFETSSASVHTILVDAISKVKEQVDTAGISSLPDTYRKTFSNGQTLLSNVAGLAFETANPLAQFQHLSNLLLDIDSRLVIVVEDLDRNQSDSFDIQEVLAFLVQLKKFPGFSFILTGGLNSKPRIDYSKLCDHIEECQPISLDHCGAIVSRFRSICLEDHNFPHHSFIRNEYSVWDTNEFSAVLEGTRPHEHDALKDLLDTPRALRLALSSTWHSWNHLCGEIDFDHLLSVETLRSSAPEAFSFLQRNWNQLRTSYYDLNQVDRDAAMKRVSQEWKESIKLSEWDEQSARTLIFFLLPTASSWFDMGPDPFSLRTQGIHQRRYWHRVLTRSIGSGEVRDQELIRDCLEWFTTRLADSTLVRNLVKYPEYAKIFFYLATYIGPSSPKTKLHLCSHVLQMVRKNQGSAASQENEGLNYIWRFAYRHVNRRTQNAKWLLNEIGDAAKVSLSLVRDLWYHWGSGKYSILRIEDRAETHLELIRILKHEISSGDDLIRRMDARHPYILFDLIMFRDNDPATHSGPQFWRWLAPFIVQGLQSRNNLLAISTASLVRDRASELRYEANLELIMNFFSNETPKLVDALIRNIDQIDDDNRDFVSKVATSARKQLGG